MSPAAGQRGAGTLLVAASALLAMVVAAVGVALSGYVAAQHAVAGAADLAAVSGATAYARGEDACRAARRIAAENRATLAGCTVTGDALGFVVRATVTRHLRAPPGLPSTVSATAEAGRLGG